MALGISGALKGIAKVLSIGQEQGRAAQAAPVCAIGDVISAWVDGALIDARVVGVLSDGRLAIQSLPGIFVRRAVIAPTCVVEVDAHEPLTQGAPVWAYRNGLTFEATIWSVWGSEVELTSGVILPYCCRRLRNEV